MFKPGDVVTDLLIESVFNGKQGLIVEVQLCLWGPPDILVKFERDQSPYYLLEVEHPNGVYIQYSPEQLRLDPDWEPEIYAERLFGNRYHTLQIRRDRLDKSKLCMVKECPHTQQKVAWINIWGTVMNVYVCEDHADHYKRYSCMDMFPFRKSG